MIKNISVIGAGTMGNGIAHVFAQSGFTVNLIDVNPTQLQRALATIEKNLDRQIAKAAITEADKKATIANITMLSDIHEGIKAADLVVEAASENIELKTDIFKHMDMAAPAGCILATNTSSISITKIASITKRPGHVIGMHFMNPVPVMKLVEVINGYETKKEVTETIIALSKQLGKIPCVVNDYPGFIANRILMPMINEAIWALYESVGTIEAIDKGMRLGTNHPMGPLELADLIGLDTCASIMNVLYKGLVGSKYKPCPLLIKYVEAGWLGRKTGRGFYDYSGEIPVPTR